MGHRGTVLTYEWTVHANMHTARDVSPTDSDTRSGDRVLFPHLAYDLANLGFADFKFIRYVTDSLLAKPFRAKVPPSC